MAWLIAGISICLAGTPQSPAWINELTSTLEQVQALIESGEMTSPWPLFGQVIVAEACTEGALQGACPNGDSDCSGGLTKYHEYDCVGTHNCATPATCHTDSSGSIQLPWKEYSPCNDCFAGSCITGLPVTTWNVHLALCVCN